MFALRLHGEDVIIFLMIAFGQCHLFQEVAKKNFCSPIYGTYQLLCSNIRESYTVDKSASHLRHGSRGSIISGKANTEVDAPRISAHQSAKLSISAVGISVCFHNCAFLIVSENTQIYHQFLVIAIFARG